MGAGGVVLEEVLCMLGVQAGIGGLFRFGETAALLAECGDG